MRFTGLPKSWQQWALIALAFVAPPLLSYVGHWSMGQAWSWPDFFHAVVGGLVAGFAGWLLPELRRETGLELPPVQEQRQKTTDIPGPGAGPLVVAILAGALGLLSSSPSASADTGTSTTAVARWEPSLSELLGWARSAGFGPTLSADVAAIGLDGKLQTPSIGIGIGVSHKWDSKRFPVELGLMVAPQLALNHTQQFGEFDLLAQLTVYKGLGVGVGWNAVQIGGDDSGWHPFHRSRLFVFLGFALTNEVPLP